MRPRLLGRRAFKVNLPFFFSHRGTRQERGQLVIGSHGAGTGPAAAVRRGKGFMQV